VINLTDPQIIAARSILIGYEKSIPVPDRSTTRAAILTLLPAIDYVMLGICASSWADGIIALKQYSQALNLPELLPTPELTGAIYIKFNPRLPNCYASAYDGSDRGVLIAAQSEDLTKLNEMFGHLPLDLFSDRSG
jgi:Domain of unknown function (DUF1824)